MCTVASSPYIPVAVLTGPPQTRSGNLQDGQDCLGGVDFLRALIDITKP